MPPSPPDDGSGRGSHADRRSPVRTRKRLAKVGRGDHPALWVVPPIVVGQTVVGSVTGPPTVGSSVVGSSVAARASFTASTSALALARSTLTPCSATVPLVAVMA